MEDKQDLQGIYWLVGIVILGWLTVVIAFYNQNWVWFVIGNIVLGLAGLTSFHIMKRYKEVEEDGS